MIIRNISMAAKSLVNKSFNRFCRSRGCSSLRSSPVFFEKSLSEIANLGLPLRLKVSNPLAMKYFGCILFLLVFVLFQACQSGSAGHDAAGTAGGTAGEVADENPAAADFDAANSDPDAIRIADEVMKAQGGRANWDRTRFLGWNFFGRRHLLWDKLTGNVRITTEGTTYLVNVNDGTGKVMKDGEEVTHPDSLAKYVEQGKNIWINDSYWLVMPYKLKDSGVTLKYLGQDTTLAGKSADILQLTFKQVGVTPNNMYWVYADADTRLITQWDFFTNATDEAPRFSTPWNDYNKHGDIQLSGDRGRGSSPI